MATVYTIQTNQSGIHPKLHHVIQKHQQRPYQKEIHGREEVTMTKLQAILDQRTKNLILDSGCGTGMSTEKLARLYPQHTVLGVDKSLLRLGRSKGKQIDTHIHHLCENAFLIRANLYDFWRLCSRNKMRFDYHFIYYPNPWPKSKQLMRRFHAHPVFPYLLHLSSSMYIRSNWLLYLEEMQYALSFYGLPSSVRDISPTTKPQTLFEQKYFNVGESVYELKTIA